jgi:hypothetical protein
MIVTVISAMLVGHWFMRDRKLEEVVQKTPTWLLVFIFFAVLVSVVLTGESESAFIYFQF